MSHIKGAREGSLQGSIVDDVPAKVHSRKVSGSSTKREGESKHRFDQTIEQDFLHGKRYIHAHAHESYVNSPTKPPQHLRPHQPLPHVPTHTAHNRPSHGMATHAPLHDRLINLARPRARPWRFVGNGAVHGRFLVRLGAVWLSSWGVLKSSFAYDLS